MAATANPIGLVAHFEPDGDYAFAGVSPVVSDRATVEIVRFDLSLAAENTNPLVLTDTVTTDSSLTAKYAQLESVNIDLDLATGGASYQGLVLALQLSSGARMWRNADRTEEYLPDENGIVTIPLSAFDYHGTVYVEGPAGGGTAVLTAKLVATPQFVGDLPNLEKTQPMQFDSIFSTPQDWFSPKRDQILDRTKTALNTNVFAPANTFLDQKIDWLSRNPEADPDGRMTKECQDLKDALRNLCASAAAAAEGTVFGDVLSSEFLVPKGPGRRDDDALRKTFGDPSPAVEDPSISFQPTFLPNLTDRLAKAWNPDGDHMAPNGGSVDRVRAFIADPCTYLASAMVDAKLNFGSGVTGHILLGDSEIASGTDRRKDKYTLHFDAKGPLGSVWFTIGFDVWYRDRDSAAGQRGWRESHGRFPAALIGLAAGRRRQSLTREELGYELP